QELTLAVIDDYFAEMKENMLDEAFSPSLAPLARLEKFIEMAIEMQTDIHQQTGHVLGCPFGNLATELATQDETIRSKLDKLFTRFQNIIRDTLQEAVDKGDVESLDVSATAHAFLAYFEGTLLLAKTHNDPQIVRQLLPAAAQIRI
ncbi:MAG: TetR/AcrR family transcriptional regulator, partial [Halobacteria archaeon]|nr:TetR/AcrR family transcriptional regulator [Halobacteria archaeon]